MTAGNDLWKFDLMDRFYETVQTVPEMFYNTVNTFGDRPGNMFREGEAWKTISYRDWAVTSEEIGNALLSIGVEKGDAVCIMSHTCPQWAWADMGNLIAGGITVTIFPTLSPDEVEYILNHSMVKYIFVGSPELIPNIEKIWESVPTLKGIICLTGDYEGDQIKYWGLDQFQKIGRSFQQTNPEALEKRWRSLTGSDGATVIYTSGTTGKLKPARFDHKGCIAAAWRGIKINALGGLWTDYTDSYFSVMPLAHVMERVYGYFCFIAIGAMIGFGTGPSTILADIQAVKPTLVVWVPRMYERILRGLEGAFCSTPEGKQAWTWAMDVGSQMIEARLTPSGTIDMTRDPVEDLTGQLREDYIKARELIFSKVHGALGGNLHALACGGARLTPELHRAWTGMGFAMVNGWGLTETMCNLSISYCNAVKFGWNAKAAPGVDMIQDLDGEALVKGVGIITEYDRDPESNVSSFTEDGYFRTGDIIEFDENGFLRIIDRKKAIIVMDTGKNVAPARIESKILSDGRIEQVLVMGDGEKFISALVVPAWDMIIPMFKASNIPFDESKLIYEEVNGMNTCTEVGEDISGHPMVASIVKEIIEKSNLELSDYETVKKYAILPRKFTQTRGELTPTLKMKNRIIFENYAREIKEIYS